MILRTIALLVSIPLAGCFTSIAGQVSARAAPSGGTPKTVALLKTTDYPSLEEQNINDCLLRHLGAAGSRVVGADDTPAAAVAFSFSNGGSPIGYRSSDTSHWQDRSQISTTAVWARRFTVYVFDATSTEKAKILWEGEVTSSGSSSSPGPVAYAFLDQIFRRYPSSAMNESFSVSPVPDACQAPPLTTR